MTHGSAYGYRKGCRCDECRAYVTEYKRRYRAGIRTGTTPPGLQVHGQHGYSAHGCRCDICRAGQAKAMREYYDRKRREAGVLKRRRAS